MTAKSNGVSVQVKKPGIKNPGARILCLYITGHTMKSRAALANLTMIGQEYTQGQYRVQVVDLIKNPLLAEGNQILAVPALIRELPIPMRQIIGDLSRQEHILVGINLYPASLAE